MNRQSMQKLRLDRRLIERSNWISGQELDSELDSLPDASHKAVTIGQAEDEAKRSANKPAPAAGQQLPWE